MHDDALETLGTITLAVVVLLSVILIAGCTYMNISGNDNDVNVDKVGTKVDTTTDVVTEEGEDENE